MEARECMKRALLYRGLPEETHQAKPRNSAGFTDAARWGLAEPRATTAACKLLTVSFTSSLACQAQAQPCQPPWEGRKGGRDRVGTWMCQGRDGSGKQQPSQGSAGSDGAQAAAKTHQPSALHTTKIKGYLLRY